MPQIQPLIWSRGRGDAEADVVLEARELPGAELSDTWQITLHDAGPSWDWFRYDPAGDVIDIGAGSSIDDCKRQIAERRGAAA